MNAWRGLRGRGVIGARRAIMGRIAIFSVMPLLIVWAEAGALHLGFVIAQKVGRG